MNLPAAAWRTLDGPDADVVVSTRCRVARNLDGVPFPWRADAGACARVATTVVEALRAHGDAWSRCVLVDGEVDDGLAARLAEERYTTREWRAHGTGCAAVVGRGGALSAMLNEEDHVRFQCVLPGLQVREAYARAWAAAEDLGDRVPLAASPEFGFLTASPANAGSGVRVSAWVHVPGLAAEGRLLAVLDAASELGSTVRGTHGEGTSGTGELFQMSNTWADARSVERALERLGAAAAYVVGEERRARAIRFGGERGRTALGEAAGEALRLLAAETSAPKRLLQLASVLRLAVAEGVLPGRLPETARWLAVAGGVDPEASFTVAQAVERTAELRALLGSRLPGS